MSFIKDQENMISEITNYIDKKENYIKPIIDLFSIYIGKKYLDEIFDKSKLTLNKELKIEDKVLLLNEFYKMNNISNGLKEIYISYIKTLDNRDLQNIYLDFEEEKEKNIKDISEIETEDELFF